MPPHVYTAQIEKRHNVDDTWEFQVVTWVNTWGWDIGWMLGAVLCREIRLVTMNGEWRGRIFMSGEPAG